MFAFGEAATLLTREVTGQDGYGSDVYTTTAETPVTGGFAPTGSLEVVQGVDTVTTTPTFYLDPGPTITPVDQLVVRGVTYDVVGDPADWRQPMTGWHAGIVVRLKVVTG